MTNHRFYCEYFILSFVPNVLRDDSIHLGILLRESESVATKSRLPFAGAKFVQQVQRLSGIQIKPDDSVIRESIKEIRAVVERAHVSGQHNELNALLRELLDANSELCAFGPHPCTVVDNPELELQTLFERFVNGHPSDPN